jgi:hypothetical protein
MSQISVWDRRRRGQSQLLLSATATTILATPTACNAWQIGYVKRLAVNHSMDVYADGGVGNWPKWMRSQIREAGYVLLVFTLAYRRRFEGEEHGPGGRGVSWEGSITQNTLYAAAALLN